MSHASLVRFLQALENRSNEDRLRIGQLLGFGRGHDFGNWIPTIMPLAHALEKLAPHLAGDGPNTEYPWPHTEPRFVPASFDFDVWRHLTESAQGRQLCSVIDRAIMSFPQFA